MKASRLTAIGLVAAAGLWIASGHFLPRETAESRAAIRVGEGEANNVAPHTRVNFCGVGRTGSIRIGIDTASGLSILRKELWDILPGHGRPA